MQAHHRAPTVLAILISLFCIHQEIISYKNPKKIIAWGKMKNTPKKRLTPTEAVEQAIQIISQDTARLKARDKTESAFFQSKAALALGYEEPFTREQQAMNTILTQLQAGYACCEKAWQMFHKLTTEA